MAVAQDGMSADPSARAMTPVEQEKDLRAHVQSYEGFISLMKWGTVSVLIVVFGVIWAIAH